MGLAFIFLIIIGLISFLFREARQVAPITFLLMVVGFIIWLGVYCNSYTLDMSTTKYTVEKIELNDISPVTIGGNATSVCYMLEDGSLHSVAFTNTRVLYGSEKNYLLIYDYKFKGFKGFLFYGMPYHYFEFHLMEP